MGTITIANGANIQAAVNSNPAGTIFQLSDGTYTGQQIQAKSGDQFVGASDGGTIFNGGGSDTPLATGNGATGVVFQNITTTNYNTAVQQAPIITGSGWQILDVTSTNNTGAGLVLGANSVVQGGNYSNNGQIGIDGYEANGAQVLNATIENNNTSGYNKDGDAGGVKFANSNNVVVSGNTVVGNNGIGIWADQDANNMTISGNDVANNNYRGIQIEISHGASITGNTITGNTSSGIFISNSDGVTASGNTVTVGGSNTGIATYTANGGIDVVNVNRGTDPATGAPYQSINDTVTSNTIIHTTDTALDGILLYQPVSGNANDVFNNDTYYVPNTTETYWFFGNSPLPYTWNGVKQNTPDESSGTDIVGSPPSPSSAPVASSPSNAGGGTTATASSSGSDTLTLRISEDAWNGDAAFTVSVDGTQIGGTYSTSALHYTGDSNVFVLNGNWGSNAQDVQIQFLNDAFGGTAATDRNLYVNSINYDGVTYGGTTAELATNGTDDFTVGGGVATAASPADTLTLHLSEDAWEGNAQFVLSVDGNQITTAQDVTTLHSSGGWEDVTFAGNFGAGNHTIGVTFTNDAFGGTASADRNLYVNGIDLNGQHYGNGVTALYTNGTAAYSVTTPG